VVVATADMAFKPKTVDHFHAVLTHVTLTAWQALVEVANVAPGQKVLVHAAAGDPATLLAIMRPSGILIATIQPPSEEIAAAHGVRQNFVSTAPPIKRVLTEVANLVDTGRLKPIVSAIMPLSETPKTHPFS
jgi:NADPH:quinone reductase-like Zn-dependent oxidoreductase